MTELTCVTGIGLGQDGMGILTAISEEEHRVVLTEEWYSKLRLFKELLRRDRGHSGSVCLL